MDELDRILSSEPEIDPSPDFARGVLASLRREATAPSPIPVPWARLAPILVCLLLALGVLVLQAVSASRSAADPEPLAKAFSAAITAYRIPQVLIALAAPLLALRFSRRFADGY